MAPRPPPSARRHDQPLNSQNVIDYGVVCGMGNRVVALKAGVQGGFPSHGRGAAYAMRHETDLWEGKGYARKAADGTRE